SNDLATRKQIFAWIKRNQDALYSIRKPLGSVGVYFSDSTRNFYPEFVRHYRGVLLLLLRKHVQFQIVTPRTLAGFAGKTLVLPGVRVLSSGEMADLRSFTAKGGRLVLTGPSDPNIGKLGHSVSFANSPGLEYLEAAEKDFERASLDSQSAFFKALGNDSAFSIEAAPDLVAYVAEANGKTHWYFANFKGLKKGNAIMPAPVENVTISAPARIGRHDTSMPSRDYEQLVAECLLPHIECMLAPRTSVSRCKDRNERSPAQLTGFGVLRA